MVEQNNEQRDAKDLGSRSPASDEAKQQGGSPQGTHTRPAQHGRQQMPGDR
jgi:hypothetical protein